MKLPKKLIAWLSVAVVLIGLVIASSLWSFRQTDAAANARNQTRLLMNRAEDLLSALKDAETGQRGFLLTGNEAFLAPYLAVHDSILLQLAQLQELAPTDATRRHLDVAAPLVTAKLTELSEVIALYRRQQIQQAIDQVSQGEGKRLMEAIRSEMKGFNQLLEVAAAQHDEQFRTHMRYVFTAVMLVSVLVLLSALAFAALAYRESQQRLKDLLHLETQHSLEVEQQSNQALQRANHTLQISEEKLAVTLNSIGDGVIATDAQGRVTLLNPLAQQLTGWTQAQASGQAIEDVFHIIHQDTRQPAPIPVKDTLAKGTIQALANHTVLIARDGSECPIADSCAPIRARDDQVVGAVLVFRDVTREHAAQRALQGKNRELEEATMVAKRANLAKSEFLATMSHEIRTPMNGVIGMIDVLQQSSLNGPQMEMTNIIHDSAFALLAVINDILDFSKIEANKLDVENIPMSIPDVVESACENMNLMALKKDIELTLFVDPAIPATVLGTTPSSFLPGNNAPGGCRCVPYWSHSTMIRPTWRFRWLTTALALMRPRASACSVHLFRLTPPPPATLAAPDWAWPFLANWWTSWAATSWCKAHLVKALCSRSGCPLNWSWRPLTTVVCRAWWQVCPVC